ncbi:hypothetical protein ACJX0J_014635, partial [Zea mays]
MPKVTMISGMNLAKGGVYTYNIKFLAIKDRAAVIEQEMSASFHQICSACYTLVTTHLDQNLQLLTWKVFLDTKSLSLGFMSYQISSEKVSPCYYEIYVNWILRFFKVLSGN